MKLRQSVQRQLSTLDLRYLKGMYILIFSSNASTVTIILPEGVNVTCDVEKKLSGVRNLVENSDEDGVHTVYIIGKSSMQ